MRAVVVGCVVVGVLAVPSVAAAWDIWVTPQVVHRPGNVTIHKSTNRRCSVTVGGHHAVLHGHMRRSFLVHVGGQAPLGRANVTVICGNYRAKTSFTVKRRTSAPKPSPTPTPVPTPTPAPTPTPTPTPTPSPTQNLPPLTPWTTGSAQISQNTEDMTAGDENCFLGEAARDAPTIGVPTGTWVYARDALFEKPASSTTWTLASYGPLYYNGAQRAVFLWYDINNNNLANQSPLDTFAVDPGYQASVIQYIWDNGVWYQSDGPACTP